jgi:hypothetical protein
MSGSRVLLTTEEKRLRKNEAARKYRATHKEYYAKLNLALYHKNKVRDAPARAIISKKYRENNKEKIKVQRKAGRLRKKQADLKKIADGLVTELEALKLTDNVGLVADDTPPVGEDTVTALGTSTTAAHKAQFP